MGDAKPELLIVRSMMDKIIVINAEKGILWSLENVFVMFFSDARNKQTTTLVKSVGNLSTKKDLSAISITVNLSMIMAVSLANAAIISPRIGNVRKLKRDA